MAKFIAKRPVEHDRKRYEAGEAIELDGEAARRLVKLGAVEASAAPADPKGVKSGK